MAFQKNDKVKDKNKYDIFPDFWKKEWGPKPKLGIVYAYNEFEAERKAYDKNLLRVNFTFKPKAVLTQVARKPNTERDRTKYKNEKQ